MLRLLQAVIHPANAQMPGRKWKSENTREVVIIGYNPGKGNRASAFGGLHIAEREGSELIYRGKVGSGFDDATLKEILMK